MVHMTELSEQATAELKPEDPFLPWGFPEELELCEAAQQGNLKQISKCIGNGTNVNFLDGFGRTPIHYASQLGNLEAVKLLVANKAQVNVTDANRVTPLHLAAKGNHKMVVKFLVMAGADVNIECASGCKPENFAPFNSETWQVLIDAAKGQLPLVEHLIQTRTISLVPQFAIKREIEKQAAKSEKKKGKKSGKGKKGGKKSGKKKKKK